ncbi:MAG: hypothetical protein F6K23_04185 [Okeania sp. SIO2C9]|uniref:hypothetical protein n=1 Tax=Okeania sp. SIO2C9 TaxID=2607791 RepID=UPI0013BF2F82|nr:hypothetical protein [Okeania sp. SIO2C9]NEQ72346.1 hypothetical protein [Okeania sp. SIO2C9]
MGRRPIPNPSQEGNVGRWGDGEMSIFLPAWCEFPLLVSITSLGARSLTTGTDIMSAGIVCVKPRVNVYRKFTLFQAFKPSSLFLLPSSLPKNEGMCLPF